MTRICSIDKCGRKHYAKGYCCAHYNRLHQTGRISSRPLTKSKRNRIRGICSLEQCDRPHYSRKLCHVHYQEMRSVLKATSSQRSCDVEGCNFLHNSKGLCKFHYTVRYAQARLAKIDALGIDTDFEESA